MILPVPFPATLFTYPLITIYGLRRFLGISLLGGGVTTMILYFVLENEWRHYIPKFFPEGDLSRVKHVFKLNVQKRFLIVFLSITLIPLPVLGMTIYSKVMALHVTDALVRTRIMSSLAGELVFIVTDSLVICFILAYFLSKSISAYHLQGIMSPPSGRSMAPLIRPLKTWSLGPGQR